MNFVKTLGLVMVLVGYATASGVLAVNDEFKYTPNVELEGDTYDEVISMRKPIPDASYTSAEPVEKTGSPKRHDFDHKTEDGKSSVHDDQKTDGGHARVARSKDYAIGDSYEMGSQRNSGFGRVLSETYKRPGIYVNGEEKEEEDFY